MKRKRKLRFTQCETKTCDMELGGKEEGEQLLKEVKVMSFSTMSNVHKAKYNMCVCGSKNYLCFIKRIGGSVKAICICFMLNSITTYLSS